MFRVPLSIFFTLVFPIIFMVIMMLTYGNIEILEGVHLINKYVLITIGMGILPLTLISLPVWIGSSSDRDYLKRLIYFHVDFKKIMISNIIAHYIIGILGIAINIIVAYLFFGLNFPSFSYFAAYISQVLLCLLVYILIGTVLGFFIKKEQVLMPLGLVLTFITYMFSGVFMDFRDLPAKFKEISSFLPLRYIMNDSFNIWLGETMWNIEFFKLSSAYIVVSIILLYIAVKMWTKEKLYKQ